MANAFNAQVEEEGERNLVIKATLVADTSDFTDQVIFDPASQNTVARPPANQAAIDEIQYSIEDGWQVKVNWDATTKVLATSLSGRGMFPVGPNYGGLQNNAGAGKTGKILVSTIGYTSGTMVATLIFHLHKQTV